VYDLRRVQIRQVKKEIRVLGLAVKTLTSGYGVIGAVFRGKLWLDGVMSIYASGDDLSGEIAEMVKTSRHFGQVRVILLDEAMLPNIVAIDPFLISESTSRPVLYLHDSAGEIDERYMFNWRGKQVTSIGLREVDAVKILDTVTSDGTPEALRVASMIANNLEGLKLHKV
jgi:endonuclease V-like protein UPF0215 family